MEISQQANSKITDKGWKFQKHQIMHEFLSHFWIRCPYYTLTTPYNCLILMFSSKICYLFTVCTRSHDPLSGENLSPHLIYPYPDRDFRFRGTLVSNGDVGLDGRKESERTNATGTTHGSIEQIGGQWYVFYHRLTHGSDYSRRTAVSAKRRWPPAGWMREICRAVVCIPQQSAAVCRMEKCRISPTGCGRIFPALHTMAKNGSLMGVNSLSNISSLLLNSRFRWFQNSTHRRGLYTKIENCLSNFGRCCSGVVAPAIQILPLVLNATPHYIRSIPMMISLYGSLWLTTIWPLLCSSLVKARKACCHNQRWAFFCFGNCCAEPTNFTFQRQSILPCRSSPTRKARGSNPPGRTRKPHCDVFFAMRFFVFVSVWFSE